MQRFLNRTFLSYTSCGLFLYAICAGFRDNYGIMLPYIVEWSGTSYAEVSFIIALGQLFFGLMQPVFGYLAMRTSVRHSLCIGILLMFTGLLLIPFSRSVPMLLLSLGILLPSGTASASFGIIMSCIIPRVGEKKAHVSAGIVAAGIGLSIFVLSPVMQNIIASYGRKSAIRALCVPVLLLIPIAFLLAPPKDALRERPERRKHTSALSLLREAIMVSAYRRITFGFLTCGFHMALIQTHLFSQLTSYGISEATASYGLSVYGLGVVAGSVASGIASSRLPMHRILGGLYASRFLWTILLLLPLPAPVLFLNIFFLGLTGVSTLAPTSGMVGKLFGPVKLGTLFGMVYLVHQIGAFCSAWLGGLCYEITGAYNGIWYLNLVLCSLAGITCWTIRETRPAP